MRSSRNLSRAFALVSLTSLITVLVACSPRPADRAPAGPGEYLDEFLDTELLDPVGGGAAFDGLYSPEEFRRLNGRIRGHIPPPTVAMEDPAILISLQGLTCRVFDRGGNAKLVYPIGVGVRRRSDGRSITPIGEFRTHGDATNDWFYIWERRIPNYFAGLPFLRIDARNHKGQHTYGLHGPITEMLLRGYVSHGCVRMRGDDIRELFTIAFHAPGTPVIIQEDADYNRYGILYDVALPRHHPSLADLPRIMTAGADLDISLDLPGDGRVGEEIVITARAGGRHADRVQFFLFNENAVWDGDLDDPVSAEAGLPVSFTTPGSRSVFAIALDAQRRPLSFAEAVIDIE